MTFWRKILTYFLKITKNFGFENFPIIFGKKNKEFLTNYEKNCLMKYWKQ